MDSGTAYLTVVFSGGLEKAATQVGHDGETGLTILKVEDMAAGTQPLAIIQVEDARPGEEVVTIAGGAEKGGALRTGLVSESGPTPALGITASSLPELIRLDTTLPDQFSGAPVFNSSGLFIGLLRAAARQAPGDANGVRDIIPANFVKQVAPSLVEKGFYPWAWLGVEGITLNLPLQEANQVPENRGAYLDQIITGSPAAEAGLRGTSGTRTINGLEVPTGGDIILAIDGTPVAGYGELVQALAFRKPGEQVTITILHNGETKDVKIVLAEKPN
jgi:2-alkenal reductase